MGFYCDLCRFVAKSVFHAVLSRNFCHNLRAFMWRKIEPKSIFVEKKRQISGLYTHNTHSIARERNWPKITTKKSLFVYLSYKISEGSKSIDKVTLLCSNSKLAISQWRRRPRVGIELPEAGSSAWVYVMWRAPLGVGAWRAPDELLWLWT